jgi:hypothetical protein
MEYVAAIIAVLATCVGVVGETRNKEERGIRKITKVGYVALALALAAFIVSAVQTHSLRSIQLVRRADAREVLLDAIDQTASPIYWSNIIKMDYGLEKADAETEKRLTAIGERINHILQIYGDTIPEAARKISLRIAVEITENVNLSATATSHPSTSVLLIVKFVN